MLLKVLPLLIACLGLPLANSSGRTSATSSRTPDQESVPSGKKLASLVEDYLSADPSKRDEIVREADDFYEPLESKELRKLRGELLKLASKVGPRLASSGLNYFYDEKTKRGKYIVKGKGKKGLFIGLHGGGLGSGDAGSMASAMGGGGYGWIFPEVLKKTEHGWTDSGTEEFVLELVEAMKRSGKVDPNRIFVTGHSMGGYGSWTLGAHHPDIFAGAAAYAGAPTVILSKRGEGDGLQNIDGVIEGVLPNLLNSRLFVFQSTDDPQVPPGPNQYAIARLAEWKEKYPEGFDYRYVEVDDRQHAAPKEGYLETQDWVAEHSRVARPTKLVWQPVLSWKRQFHWVYWRKPTLNSIVQFDVTQGNRIEITTIAGKPDFSGMSILVGDPLFNMDEEIVVIIDGEERYRGTPERSFSTLLMTLPRYDDDLLFDARVDL